jgi:hypothetical protein
MIQKVFQSGENKAVALFVFLFALIHFGALYLFGVVG